jgi:F-type H+-transporting ATPase subunit b
MATSGWTLAFQLINFLVLIWLLRRFLYRPVLTVIEKRRAEMGRVMAEAAGAKKAAESERSALAADRAQVAMERDRTLEQAASAAQRERESLLESARAEAQILETEARKQIERERSDARETLIDEAALLASEIARRLLATAALASTATPFLDRALAALAAMPPSERDRLLLPNESLTVVSAAPLDQGGRTTCQSKLADALGKPVNVTFLEDPELLAGVELRFPRVVLRHNWRDELADIRQQLSVHERAAQNA